MSTPAFQIIGHYTTEGSGFGLEDFGTGSFGGTMYPAEDLPPYHIGSDDLQQSHRKRAAEILHTRLGVPVSVRPWTTFRRWRVNFNAISESDLPIVQDFFEARIFKFLPSGDPAISITVRWVDIEFAPEYLFPGQYSLAFEIEEIPA